MSNVLALKFGSNTDLDQMLGVLTNDEVIDIIKDRLRCEVRAEVAADYESQIGQLEDDIAENCDWQSTAESWECDAIGLFRAMEEALTVPWSQGVEILRRGMQEHGGDIDETPPPPALPL